MVKKEEKIAERAYYKYLERGGQHGKDLDDWIEAEKEEIKPNKTKSPAKKTSRAKTKSK